MKFLIYGALLPPCILMMIIYKQDKVEREPIGLVLRTVVYGAISVIPVLFAEIILGKVISAFFYPYSLIGMLIDNFIGVALVEEFFKMKACKLSVWNHPDFNYIFDGIVYSVASAIGFAALENVSYALSYGNVATVVVRAITAIPGHTIFGIFMGIHLGLSKYYRNRGEDALAKKEEKLALLIPILLHGTYDFMCAINSSILGGGFFIFLIVLDIVAIKKVKRVQKEDRMIL